MNGHEWGVPALHLERTRTPSKGVPRWDPPYWVLPNISGGLVVLPVALG